MRNYPEFDRCEKSGNRKCYQGLSCEAAVSLESNSIIAGMVEEYLFIEKKQCDLIIFIVERSSYIGNELSKYLLNQLESHLSIPVLSINIKVSE